MPYDPVMASHDSPLAAALERVGDRWSLLVVEALNLHVQSVGWLRRTTTRRYRRTELVFLAVHAIALPSTRPYPKSELCK